ncbi:MAG: Rrf2 family transcriptional regulator [Dehalococcoidia bacterium]|nr:Rrf2 family transcriptional regulator [Dehalococcoidia bacterium]
MKLSMRGDYGVRALIDLAQHFGQGPVQSNEIAERQYVPEPYLDQLLTVLRKAGFITSRRGPQGGHVLARDPWGISLAEMVSALEGSAATIGCLDGSMDCNLSGQCGQQEIWRSVTDGVQRILESTTLGSLAERQNALKQSKTMYYI